ncbi:N-acetyltransferase family protein [Algoriphagus sp. D3-2-R+10]|uniref:GNAT family N-acetyltransferase n=1 Tax=Algoriphagus aurantiacus TaxID=3103948 RepID=UPI002B3FB71F|nr:GNAT family N-acetyltransferase [Algoriphagus sp. D3-2-R+10]MEB2777420.1 N-acetyltransferase family protein [Algoriphagus sp. D3-2-R+10]
MDKILFRNLTEEDWEQVSEIYRQGLDTGNATFASEVPSWSEWDTGHSQDCRLVAEMDGLIVGWAALSPVSSRCVYGGVAEVSIYISNNAKGQNIGTKLLEKLVAESEQKGFWTLQAGIFPENKASIVIHERTGFRKVGFRERIGQMKGVWRDTILMERRSKIVGID